MERCPNCKARYRKGETCRRCGMELKWLLKIEQSAESLRQQIIQALKNEEWGVAKRFIQQHQQLIEDPWINRMSQFLDARQE